MSAGKPSFVDAMRDPKLTTRPDDAPPPPGDKHEDAQRKPPADEPALATDITTMYHAGKRPRRR